MVYLDVYVVRLLHGHVLASDGAGRGLQGLGLAVPSGAPQGPGALRRRRALGAGRVEALDQRLDAFELGFAWVSHGFSSIFIDFHRLFIDFAWLFMRSRPETLRLRAAAGRASGPQALGGAGAGFGASRAVSTPRKPHGGGLYAALPSGFLANQARNVLFEVVLEASRCQERGI